MKSELGREALRENGLHNLAGNISEPEVSSCVTEGEPLVIEPEQMKDRCVEIMDVHRILHHLSAEFVRLAVREASFHATPREPG